MYEFDENKSQSNLMKHGINFIEVLGVNYFVRSDDNYFVRLRFKIKSSINL